MKRFGYAAAAVCILLFAAGCKSTEQEARDLEGVTKTEVLEHKGSSLGINKLPVWVETYIESGITGLEKLSDYNGNYCFVGEMTGTNLEAVRSWADSFDVPREIAGTVSSRVESLFTGAANGSPDGVYGTYFEDVVKASASATYSGARKINDWWLRTRTYDVDDEKSYTDLYRAFVLYVIPKDTLDEQVSMMLEKIANEDDSDMTADQQAAAANVRSIMQNSGF